jgi:hypothetical protein
MTPTELNETLTDAEAGNIAAESAVCEALRTLEHHASRDIAPSDWPALRTVIDRCRASARFMVRVCAETALRAEYARRERADLAARLSPR